MRNGVTVIINRSDEEPVTELALCEQNNLILKPNQLYRFVVMPDCEECARLAALTDQNGKSSGNTPDREPEREDYPDVKETTPR